MKPNRTNPSNNNLLHEYQEADISVLFQKMERSKSKLLYQLPTGGGKTVIFSEITKRFIKKYNQKVIVLTHRIELCIQTLKTLKRLGIQTKVIDSSVKKLINNRQYECYVAMVETLKNRIRDKVIKIDEIGLVIIDEAHHNSFRKLLGEFKNATVVGVTATPLSSDINLPMHKSYDELIVGESIDSLISNGFLAKPNTWKYDVELNTLETGLHGDYTVKTSDELYSSPAMIGLLIHAYNTHSKNKKTLIFNNGIFTSRKVYQAFNDLGLPVRHLDNKTNQAERIEILKWFKKTKGAILTSVSMLTTGFDEPSVQTVILNRATTSLTLYHQMIGRGSRRLPQKKTFSIIDLGNNTTHFGEWSDPVDWNNVFENPEEFSHITHHQTSSELHHVPSALRSKFPNSLEISFDIQKAHQYALERREKPKIVIRDSIRQHALMCVDNSSTIAEALELTEELDQEIDWRVKQYVKCLGTVTKNYTDWLRNNYKEKLKILIKKIMSKRIFKVA